MSEVRSQKSEYRIQKAEDRLFCFLFFVPVVLIVGGGAGQMPKSVRICPGKESVTESLSLLRVQLESAVPLKADGQCLLQYHDENGRPKKENFPVKLFVNPPAEIYLQGDVAFDPKGIILGSNKEEFWLAIRPKEISTYWWGRWAEQDGFNKLVISPKTLLEAFGVVEFADEEN